MDAAFYIARASTCCFSSNKTSFKTVTHRRSNVNLEIKNFGVRINKKIYHDKNVRLQIRFHAFPKRSKKDMDIKCEMESSANDHFVTQKLVDPVASDDSGVGKDNRLSEAPFQPDLDNGIGSGGSFYDGRNGSFPPKGGGGGGGDDGRDEEVDPETAEYGPILKFEEIMRETKARDIQLPSDMLEAAKSIGIRKNFLENYMNLQGSGLLGFGIRTCSLFRNRMLADRSFLFKLGIEIAIDSCCATFAEIQKRGKDFWNEFELYAADLFVGIAVDIALVSMLAPYARISKPSTSKGIFSRMGRAYSALPSSVFEAERPGCSFSVKQRIATYFYKGLMYGAVGFGCGLLGQGIANFIMTAKRSVNTSDEHEDVPVPPLFKSAALWGVFLGYSSNTRYQIINGLERVVEASPMSKRFPAIAMAFTVGARFSNNIYGGMQFVDWARLSGCQ